MFSKVFPSALTLQIGEHRLQFKSTQELAFVLSSKTHLSPRRAASLVRLNDTDLVKEADAFRDMAQKVGEAIVQAEGNPDSIDHFLRTLDHQLIEEDNSWSEFLSALSHADSQFGAFKLTAISSYRIYLNAGRELVEAVFAERRHGDPKALVIGAIVGEPKARQRLIFSVSELLGYEPGNLEFSRLPKGEPISVQFEPHQSMSLMLAKHKFVLVSGEPWLLIDLCGHETRLYESTTIVGRHPDADVVIYPGYLSVSGKHLLIETDGLGNAGITDTSSMGTFAALHETGGVVH